MEELRVNVEFQRAPAKWHDSTARAEHLLDRMQLRGIGLHNIKEAVRFGAKKRREDGSIIAEYRWYKVVYREFFLPAYKKIYPITVLFAHEN